MAGPQFFAGLKTPVGFALNPRKYLNGLAQGVAMAGAQIFGDSPVVSVANGKNGQYILTTPNGQVQAKKIVLATNGYSSEDLPTQLVVAICRS